MTNQQTAQQEPTFLNGVSVTGIFETIDAVNANNELAKFQFRANNKWLGGGHNRSTIKGFYGCSAEDESRSEPFVLDADEPAVLLGNDAGANPVEFVLHALVACMTTSMVYHAAARGIEIEAVESWLEGDLDLRGFLGISEEVRKGYHGVRVAMRVKSKAAPEKLRELTQFSPVYDVVSNSLPVDVVIDTY